MKLQKLGPQDYTEYLKHQASKLPRIKGQIVANEWRCRIQLRERVGDHVSVGMNVLCLGARLGGEVKAFIDCGCFAVGLDLNPGEGNKHVVHGDFHYIQFADDSVDVVFTNSVDHVFDLEKFISEISRVLKAGGLLIIDFQIGAVIYPGLSSWESLWWLTTDDILAPFLASQFEVVHKQDFAWPWAGEQVILRRGE